MGDLVSMGDKASESVRLHRGADISQVLRVGLVVVAVTFGGIGSWAVFAPLRSAVVAQGVVKVDLNRKTVQHMEGGIVREILVRDGDHVQAGQTLLVVGNETVDATVDSLKGQLVAEEVRMARLDAERGYKDKITFPADLEEKRDDPEIGALMEREEAYFGTKRDHLNSQIDLLDKQGAQVESEVQALAQEVDAMKESREFLGGEIKAAKDLQEKSFGDKMKVLQLERSYQEYVAREGENLADIARARQKRTDMQLKATSLRRDYVESAANDLTVSQAKVFDLEERVRPSVDAEVREQITAPISGTVVGLRVFTIGGVVAPRDPLLDIVPDETLLIIEAMVDVNNIDEVRVGQDAEVRLTAYQSRTTPYIIGKVTYVSADRLTNPQTQAPYYVVEVTLDPQSLHDASDIVHLTPGMAADVYIKTGVRTALDYLLDPMTSFLRRSFRET